MGSEIINKLQELEEAKEPVRFINTYYGMTVSYYGEIIKITGNRILLKVAKPQLLCMTYSRSTLLEHKQLPKMIYASVRGVDMEREIVELWGFDYYQFTFNRRSAVRIELREPVRMMITPQGSERSFPMGMVEISTRGLAAVVSITQFDVNRYGQGTALTAISHKLPFPTGESKDTVLNYSGIIRNIHLARNMQSYRLGIQTYPKPQTERLIIRFIALRQRELCKEIKGVGMDLLPL